MIRLLVAVLATLVVAGTVSAAAIAAPGTDACSNLSLSLGVDPTGGISGTANCSVTGRSGAVNLSGMYAYALDCPANNFSYSGSLTATWGDGTVAFTTGYRVEIITWNAGNAFTGNLDSG